MIDEDIRSAFPEGWRICTIVIDEKPKVPVVFKGLAPMEGLFDSKEKAAKRVRELGEGYAVCKVWIKIES